MLKIRSADLTDYDEILDLYRCFRPKFVPISELKSYLDKYPSAVVYKNNALVGFAYCYLFSPDILELANIYIAPNNRGEGVGSSVLGYIEKEIKQSDYKGLILSNSDLYEAKENKKNAESFYIKNKYKEIASTQNTRVYFKLL